MKSIQFVRLHIVDYQKRQIGIGIPAPTTGFANAFTVFGSIAFLEFLKRKAIAHQRIVADAQNRSAAQTKILYIIELFATHKF